MRKEFINPSTLPNWDDTFTQIVTASGDYRTVYISGQVSVDEQNNLIGAGDLAIQAMRAFQNLEAALIAAGAHVTDVVKLNVYVCNFKPDDAGVVKAALRKYFPHGELPASTWLGVQALAIEGLLIEVDAIAVVDG